MDKSNAPRIQSHDGHATGAKSPPDQILEVVKETIYTDHLSLLTFVPHYQIRIIALHLWYGVVT